MASLFTADASYEISPSPFPQPLRGNQGRILDYWQAAASSDKRVSFDHEVLAMAKATGIARWWATVDEDGLASQLEGFYVVRLARRRALRLASRGLVDARFWLASEQLDQLRCSARAVVVFGPPGSSSRARRVARIARAHARRTQRSVRTPRKRPRQA